MYQHPFLALLASAVLTNIALGYIREACPKFSLKWFFWIFASIPFLIYFRIKFLISAWLIPVAIVCVMAGQILGGRLRRRFFSQEDIEGMEQIPDLKIYSKEGQRIEDGEIMVVLLNMGGPKKISEVRGFLKRIFCDELIIRFPFSSISQPVFANLLVALRGREAERRYGLIGGKSPIFKSTSDQTIAVQNELNKRGRNLQVIFSFNYSNPLPEETITQIKSAGKKYILPLSLYPHYSAATTGSNTYYLKKASRRLYPELNFLSTQSYYLADSYIEAFAQRVREALPGESLDDFYLLFSAHGLPLYFLAEGDLYPFQIAQTVAKILDRLARRHAWAISYQSAVGPMRWLKPSTEAMIKALARRGIKKLIVVPISFVTDHIETLCEIDIEYRAFAAGLGIKDFRMSKALECHPGFINALADCVEESLDSHRER